MKKNIRMMRLIAGIVAFLAFFTLFGHQLVWTLGDPLIKPEITNLSFIDVAFGKKGSTFLYDYDIYKGNMTGLFGYIFIIVGSIIGIVTSFVKKGGPKTKYIIDVLLLACLFGGAVMILLERIAFINSNIGNVDNTLAFAPWPIIGSCCVIGAGITTLIGIIIDK